MNQPTSPPSNADGDLLQWGSTADEAKEVDIKKFSKQKSIATIQRDN